MADLCSSGGISPGVVAGILVGVVAVCSVIAGLVAYKIGFMLAVKRIKAFKTAEKAQGVRAYRPRGTGTGLPKFGGGGGGGGGVGFGRLFNMGASSRNFDTNASGQFLSGQFSSSNLTASANTISASEMGFMSAESLEQGASSSMLGSSSSFKDKSSSQSGSVMGSAGKISVFNRKKKRAAQQARRAADGRLREAMKCSGYEDLRSAITFAEREGSTPELLEAANILADRLVVGFLGFDLRPDEQPYHVRKDLPLAKKMGAAPSVLVPEGSSQGMPGQVPSPTMKAPEDEAGEGRSAPSAEAGRLRGFIQPASGNEQESSELETLIKRDDRHSSLEDCAWVSVPKPGGGVRYYNYVSQKHREAHDGKLSRDLHYKPEARLRVAEDAIVSLVGEVHELSGKAEAASTQVALLRDELKASTRERWYSNHRSRWHNDPATTLHVDWSQLAGLVAKSCTDAANECIAGSRISGMADAARMCQQVCGRIHHGLSVAAYVSCTGILQTAQLTYEAEASSGPSRLLGRVLPASKCKITYLAMSSGETVHVADVKSDDRIFFWRGYATGGGSFAAIPIFAPGSGQCVGVLSVDTMHRPPVKQLSTVELEAMEVIANGLGGILEAAMEAERASCSRSIAATAEAARSTRVGAVGMAGPGPAEARAAQNIALSCGMQAAENALRGPRGSGDQLEAAILELEGLESPSRAIVAVCSALLTVIDYDVIISEMEARQWAVPVDRDEQMSLWHSVILSGMDEIATNMRMVFDHLAPADVSVPNCLRFERAEALLAAITLDDITAKGTPMVVQLIYQWLIAAQEVNNLAVVGREAEVAAQQLGEQAAKFRPGQVTADVLCDIICKRLG